MSTEADIEVKFIRSDMFKTSVVSRAKTWMPRTIQDSLYTPAALDASNTPFGDMFEEFKHRRAVRLAAFFGESLSAEARCRVVSCQPPGSRAIRTYGGMLPCNHTYACEYCYTRRSLLPLLSGLLTVWSLQPFFSIPLAVAFRRIDVVDSAVDYESFRAVRQGVAAFTAGSGQYGYFSCMYPLSQEAVGKPVTWRLSVARLMPAAMAASWNPAATVVPVEGEQPPDHILSSLAEILAYPFDGFPGEAARQAYVHGIRNDHGFRRAGLMGVTSVKRVKACKAVRKDAPAGEVTAVLRKVDRAMAAMQGSVRKAGKSAKVSDEAAEA